MFFKTYETFTLPCVWHTNEFTKWNEVKDEDEDEDEEKENTMYFVVCAYYSFQRIYLM